MVVIRFAKYAERPSVKTKLRKPDPKQQVAHTAVAAEGQLEWVRKFMDNDKLQYVESPYVNFGQIMLRGDNGPVCIIDMLTKEATVWKAGESLKKGTAH